MNLISYEINSNETDNIGDSITHLAVGLDKTDILENLIKNYEVGLDLKDSRGDTPTHKALKAGKLYHAILLIESGKIDLNAVDAFSIDIATSISDMDESSKYILEEVIKVNYAT